MYNGYIPLNSLPLLSTSIIRQVLAVKKGTLSVKYHYYHSNRRCDGCCGNCEYRFYACTGTHCYQNDISGSRGHHSGREVNEGRFNQINTQPWRMDYPVSLCLCLEQPCMDASPFNIILTQSSHLVSLSLHLS